MLCSNRESSCLIFAGCPRKYKEKYLFFTNPSIILYYSEILQSVILLRRNHLFAQGPDKQILYNDFF